MPRFTHTTRIIDNILTTIATAGVVTTALVSPQAAELLSKPLLKHYDKKSRNRELARLIHYMKRQKLIEVRSLNNDSVEIIVTDKGRQRAKNISLHNLHVKKPIKWDKLWRVVIFDIPERSRAARDALRSHIKDLGFVQIQRSVWVHPFPCLEEIAILRNLYDVEPYVSLFEATEFEGHNKLVKKFSSLLTD